MVKRVRPWIVLLLIFIFASCSSKGDEKALEEMIQKAANLAEAHDIGGIINLTTKDFEAQPGGLNRRETKRILFMAFRHYGKLKVFYPKPSVDLESEKSRSTLSFPFLIVKKNQSLPALERLYNDPKGWMEAVGEGADLYRFKLKAEKMDGDWLVKSACLERFTGIGFSRCKE